MSNLTGRVLRKHASETAAFAAVESLQAAFAECALALAAARPQPPCPRPAPRRSRPPRKLAPPPPPRIHAAAPLQPPQPARSPRRTSGPNRSARSELRSHGRRCGGRVRELDAALLEAEEAHAAELQRASERAEALMQAFSRLDDRCSRVGVTAAHAGDRLQATDQARTAGCGLRTPDPRSWRRLRCAARG